MRFTLQMTEKQIATLKEAVLLLADCSPGGDVKRYIKDVNNSIVRQVNVQLGSQRDEGDYIRPIRCESR